MFYAKHLRSGDMTMAWFIVRHFYMGLRGLAVGIIKRRPRWSDERRGIFAGFPGGLVAGWRAYSGASRRG
jgi:hypothetical protein